MGEAGSSARFCWVKAPTSTELTQLTHAIAHRLARYLQRQGLLERDADESLATTAKNVAGFSLHAGVVAKANQRDKLERLCRYITRPAISGKRLLLTHQGKVRYELKTPYRDGTTHVAAPAHPAPRH